MSTYDLPLRCLFKNGINLLIWWKAPKVRQVKMSKNVSLNKATTQSPECLDYEGASHLAVDGNTTTEFGESKPHACTCARGTSSTFWSVDLGKPYPLHNIRIFQRNSCKSS
ncbi:uncharacterized protein LOC121373675 [Gigantopelta aegis]|uniref:uncharacterized protein LOC121373675 n=1 Tax=Gigantopelta aegis TaxID=1735272 RepID=UPI001B88BC95|nr:uncharacterized protein LOC121373675 [Gigantopelta aegis]